MDGYITLNSSLLASQNLNVIQINLDAPPTFTRNTDKGRPDLTVCSQPLIEETENWEVLEEPSFTDHQFIQTNVKTTITSHTFKSQEDINNFISHLQVTIIEACNKVFKIKSQPIIETPVWWTNKLESNKKRIRALRRRTQRSHQNERTVRKLFWKAEAKKHVKEVRRTKSSGWKDLCTKATNPYVKHFKSVQPSQLSVLLNASPEGGHQKIAQDILDQIFPYPTTTTSTNHHLTTYPDDCPHSRQKK
ncbi:hypothetical protein AVEN_83123-1 [Araneus ventricosus]|uniref:Endonuclease/exonuclease/phosphatase domain-containing protein n=1 Tax=Araneus ventricosus TaxID=182803 RepID=A0A4Y2AP81_ARAVE|nr:hypothetical protein AVEN_83123-1 [Araneus ventricosus]